MSNRNDGAGELEARWLTREEMHSLMKKLRDAVAAGELARNAERGPQVLDTGTVYPVEEEERRAELKRQADELAREGERE